MKNDETINETQAEEALGEFADKVGEEDVKETLGKEDEIKKLFKRVNVLAKYCNDLCDIFELLPPMNLTIDLAFIDANKRTYVDYYHLIMRHLRIGGYILADNTLWDGHVIDPAYANDPQTRGICDFNDLVASDPRVEKFIIPLRDGLTLIRRIAE